MYVINWDYNFAKIYYPAVIEAEAIIKAILEENKKLSQEDREWIRSICLLKWARITKTNTKIIYINTEKRPAYISKEDLNKYVKKIKKIGVIEYIRKILRKIELNNNIIIRFASYPKGSRAWWVKVVK
jgi:hypothetical protein